MKRRSSKTFYCLFRLNSFSWFMLFMWKMEIIHEAGATDCWSVRCAVWESLRVGNFNIPFLRFFYNFFSSLFLPSKHQHKTCFSLAVTGTSFLLQHRQSLNLKNRSDRRKKDFFNIENVKRKKAKSRGMSVNSTANGNTRKSATYSLLVVLHTCGFASNEEISRWGRAYEIWLARERFFPARLLVDFFAATPACVLHRPMKLA